MARWEPGAQQRLQAAALDLFQSRGFEGTTAADIAQAAGLTERTFFRYFADKREVLFDGQHLLLDAFLRGVVAAPDGATAMAMVTAALEGSADFFPEERREHARLRQRVVDAHPALQERELLKMAGLASAVAEALRERGVPEPSATLAAEAGIAVFKVAFGQWVAEGEERTLPDLQRKVAAQLAVVLA